MKRMFLCINATNQNVATLSRFLAFDTPQQADAYVRDWLSRSCGLDCYTGREEEAALRAKNGGELPEFSFACPEIVSGADLERYNGYHYFASGGAIQLFLVALYDTQSALRFRREITKEYALDKTDSEEADEMIAMLERLQASFEEELDDSEALQKVDELIRNEGLPLF